MVTSQTFLSIKEYEVYLRMLPKRLAKESEAINMEMARSLRRRIRMRAPVGTSPWATGSLKQVNIVPKGKSLDIIGPGHWSFVNAGAAPNKYIPVEFMEAHRGNPGSTAGKRAQISKPKKWVFAGYQGGKGFVDRSFTTFRKEIKKILDRGINKALKK